MFAVRHLFVLALASIVCTGCGDSYNRPKLVKVKGTVTLDGTPVGEASVVFEPVTLAAGVDPKYKRASNAVTDAQGGFQMSTYGENDGLPPGKYKVAVIKQSRQNPPGMDPEMATPEQLAKVVVKDLVPKKYSDINSSGLEVEVTSSGMKPDSLALQSK